MRVGRALKSVCRCWKGEQRIEGEGEGTDAHEHAYDYEYDYGLPHMLICDGVSLSVLDPRLNVAKNTAAARP